MSTTARTNTPPALHLTAAELGRLLQLASPALPVGAFSYSGGLEAAVDHGLVHDAHTAHGWIGHGLREGLACGELPVVARLHDAWTGRDLGVVRRWNGWFLASRDSAELHQETEHLGWALVQLSEGLAWGEEAARASLRGLGPVSYPCAHAFATVALGVGAEAALVAYGFAWLENQVAAAIKAVPLGQTAGQRVLFGLAGELPDLVERALGTADEEIVAFAPQLGILSSRHAFQYSRLFRS